MPLPSYLNVTPPNTRKPSTVTPSRTPGVSENDTNAPRCVPVAKRFVSGAGAGQAAGSWHVADGAPLGSVPRGPGAVCPSATAEVQGAASTTGPKSAFIVLPFFTFSHDPNSAFRPRLSNHAALSTRTAYLFQLIEAGHRVARGNVMMKVAPLPGSLSTRRCP